LPPGVAVAKEASCSSPRPQNHRSVGVFPVKNTFIHYGTPVRGTTGSRSTPKTVPHDFAPEAEFDASLWPAPISVGSQPRVSAPISSPMPNTGGRPGPEAWRAAAERDGQQPARGRGVAPLRLFDFLPSPTTVPALQPPLWQPLEQSVAAPTMAISHHTMAPPPPYAPMAMPTDGSLQASTLQASSIVQPSPWSSWNGGGDLRFSSAAPVATMPGCMMPSSTPGCHQLLTGVPMPPSQSTNHLNMMAPTAPVFVAAPVVQQLPPLSCQS